MPRPSYPYAVGRIRVLETRMLDGAKWSRLREADYQEGLRIPPKRVTARAPCPKKTWNR
jgi:hypothetical protein